MSIYFDLGPRDDQPALSLNDTLTRIVVAFPHSSFNREVAVRDAAERLKHLIALQAPEQVLTAYRQAAVVRCRVAGLDSQAFLEFDAWGGQALLVYPHPEGSGECVDLVRLLADVLGYYYEQQEYD